MTMSGADRALLLAALFELRISHDGHPERVERLVDRLGGDRSGVRFGVDPSAI
jgi:hypothetical protein